MTTKNLTIIIFPHLFIQDKEGIQIEDLILRPCYSENIETEQPVAKSELYKIASLFRDAKNNSIRYWSYIVTHLRSQDEWKRLADKLNKFTTTIRFSELCTLRGDASFSQFDFFVFEIPKPRSDTKLIHYAGSLNGESDFSFYIFDNEVENPYSPIRPVNPKILEKKHIQEKIYYQFLYGEILKDKEQLKILRALEWFNRSFSHENRGLDSSEAVLNLHTALEALLRPQDDQAIKVQIKTALLSILGQSEDLFQWFDSFWKLRNSIVHGDSEKPQFMYIHPLSKQKKGHRHHALIAREVFVKCIDGVLKMRSEFSLIGFDEKLMSNEIRIDHAIKEIKKANNNLSKLYRSGAFSRINSLRQDEWSSSKIKTKTLGELLLPYIQTEVEKETKSDTQTKVLGLIKEIREWKDSDLGKLALAYEQLSNAYSELYANTHQNVREALSLRLSADNFFDFAIWRLLVFGNK